MAQEGRFEGKRAVVTGAASGIGRATALRLAEEGATVLAGDIDAAGGETLRAGSDGRPEDIAAAVTFLLSDDASFVTGTHLLVDGGMLVGTRPSWDPDAPGVMSALDAFR